MAQHDSTKARVEKLFDNHFRSNSSLDDINALDAVLPDDPAVLRGLATRCFEGGRKARHAGHHIDGRRLDILGWQLRQRAESIERRA